MATKTIEYATNNAYDTVLLMMDGRVRSAWTVTPQVARAYLVDRAWPDQWDDQLLDHDPSDYGELIGDDQTTVALRIAFHSRGERS